MVTQFTCEIENDGDVPGEREEARAHNFLSSEFGQNMWHLLLITWYLQDQLNLIASKDTYLRTYITDGGGSSLEALKTHLCIQM